jgi:hypothetical protein
MRVTRPTVKALSTALRELADDMERASDEEQLSDERLNELGAMMLDTAAAIAHRLGFTAEAFRGLARLAWRRRDPRRAPN